MRISQPKNKSINTPNGYLALRWTPNFGKLTAEKFQRAQEYVDNTCIRLMKPYTPFRNGFLEKSATLGTVIGSGEIKQIVPYARYQYYGKVYGPNIPLYENGEIIGYFSRKGQKKHPTGADLKYDTSKHPQAGKMWFERMKADHKDTILRKTAKIVGGTPK